MKTVEEKQALEHSVYEEGALKYRKLTPMEVIWTIVGCGIGSGSLGTAYAADLPAFR